MDFYIEKDKDLYGVNFFKDDIVHFEVMLTKYELLQLVQKIFNATISFTPDDIKIEKKDLL